MLRKLVVALSVVALVAPPARRTPRREGEPTCPSRDPALGTEAGPLVVQVPSGSVLFERLGVRRASAARGCSATPSAGSTLLQTVDGADAEPASTVRLDGTLDVRVVAESGRAVALMDPLPDGWDPEVPLPRSRTSIVVADPTGPPRPGRTTCAGTSSRRRSRPTTGGCS